MASVREFGAKGDGQADDTTAIQHAIDQAAGLLTFPPGTYRLTKPLQVPLDRQGPIALEGSGGTARLLMTGPGPAVHLVGSHTGSALPSSAKPGLWIKERMPTVTALEIVGRHPEADGVRCDGTMQATLHGVLIRQVRHGVHLVNRNRNVAITDCHIYDNTGIGVFLDQVNLHQINVTGSHISYCRRHGLAVIGSEVRNIQIVGNDIEYNHDLEAEGSADILFDCREGTVREGTIVGNTIQAVVNARGGAAVRLLGVGPDNPNAVGLLAINGNLLGSRERLFDFQSCRGVVVSGNCLYSGRDYALYAVDSTNLVISGNTIDHNPEYKGTSTDAVLLERCRDVSVSGLVVQHTREPEQVPPASVEVRGGENINLTGCQVIGSRRVAVLVSGEAQVVRVADCTVRGGDQLEAGLKVEPTARRVLATNNFVTAGSAGAVLLPRGCGAASGNLTI